MAVHYPLLMLSLVTLTVVVYFIGLHFQKIELLKLAAISTALFFAGYIICSGFYLWLDCFQFVYVLLTECLCFCAGVCILVLRKKKAKFVVEHRSRSKIIYFIILCGFLISLPKFTFFGMGQDEGVYQTKAIALAHGYTERQFDFEEYQLLETDEQRETYDAATRALAGLYRHDSNLLSIPTASEEERWNLVSGVFHGIPTFPAVLGLVVKIFGLSAMQQVQSIFFLCAAFFVLFIAENMGLKKSSQCLVLSVVALSPIVQWTMKSALTEGFLVLALAWFIYHITDNASNPSALLSAAPVCAFAFWHVSIFTIMPLFICVYVMAYEETKNRQYIYAGIISLAFFSMGNGMMLFTSPGYTINNIILNLTFLTPSKVFPAFLLASVLGAVLLLYIDKCRFHIVYEWLKKERVFSWLFRGFMLVAAIATCRFAYLITTGIIQQPHGFYSSGPTAILHLSIWVLIFGTGVVALPLCIAVMIGRPVRLLQNKNTLLITVVFLYCVIFMSAFLRRDVPYAYYYARYWAPFVVVCGVTVGIALDKFAPWVRKVVLVCTLCLLFPYNWVLFTEKDDSRMEWHILSEIAEHITENSAIVFDGAPVRLLMIPLKAMTGADVYPAFEDKKAEMGWLSTHYQEIFVVTNNIEQSADTNRERYIYMNQYIASEDEFTNRDPVSQFPMGFTQRSVSVGIRQYINNQYQYDFSQESVPFTMAGGVEEEYFRWILGEGSLTATLSEKTYLMKVVMGPSIPLARLGKEQLRVNIAVNGRFLQSYYLTNENMQEPIQILIPKADLVDGYNTITFSGDSWSPAELGSGDTRRLLFSVQEISFTEINPLIYDFGEQEFFGLSGFSGNEETHRWTAQSPAEVEVPTLQQGVDYQCTLRFGAVIPEELLKSGNYRGRIVLNRREDSTIPFTILPGQEELTFTIDGALLTEDTNRIQIFAPLWHPSSFGLPDTRALGISIDKLIFTPQGDAA